MLKTRNRKIGLLALLLAVVLVFTVLPEIPRLTLATDEAEVIASGECGDNVTWTLDEDGVLTISGTGEMEDYGSSGDQPWYDYRSQINKIIINQGIMHVGQYSFTYCNEAEISLPDGLISIGYGAFRGNHKLQRLEIPDSVTTLGESFAELCDSLEYIKLPSGLETIPRWAFSGCTSLTEITLPETLVTIKDYAFDDCTSLASVTIPDSVTFVGVEAFPDTTDVQYPDDLSRIEDGSYKRVDTVYVTGTLNYEYAYEVLELVNEERAAEGYEPLTMDTELLEAAMQRAAENSLYYSHTRPCGLSSMTMIESHSLGENIAAGYTTPTAVMTAWMNSSGHRANILMSSYQSIGIGCFYSNGYYYWVQLFTHLEAAESAQQENYADSTETMSVMIEPDLFQDYLNLNKTSVSIDPGESTSVTASMTNSQTAAGRKVKLEPESFTWTSSDPSVATVDASGQITGISPGTATITAATTTTGELYRTVEVTVIGEDLSGCTITLSDTEYTYDGTAKEPAVTVTFNGKTLVQDVDYTLSYSSNTTAGTGYAVVTGIEAYSGTAQAAFTIYPVVTPDTITVAVGETATITTAGFPGNVYAGFHSGVRGVADITSDDNGQLTVTGVKAGTVVAAIYGSNCYNEAGNYLESYVTITVTDESGSGDTGDGSGNGDTDTGDTGDDGSGNTGSGGSSSDDGSDTGSDGSGDEDTDPGNDDSGNTGSGDDTGTSGDTLMVRRGNTMYFNYTLKGGNADFSTNAGRSTDQVLVGDWDGDGVDTICLRRGNVCYFIDNITTMHVYLTVTYGRPGDEVLVGDWDGDGCDSLAMRRNGNYYYFCNDITNPDGDTWSATYGRAADEVHVGDWEGRGYDFLAVRRDGNYYYFSLSKVTDPDGDVWKTTFGRAGDEVLVGDWDANGTDTLAMRRDGNSYFISNSIANPDSDVDEFTFGRASDEVYAGKWK